uniref:Uncharacterized protein n=1 Tax=Meloidogyne incognita TaxID=6306 RepID=A0A914NZV7_MELIC
MKGREKINLKKDNLFDLNEEAAETPPSPRPPSPGPPSPGLPSPGLSSPTPENEQENQPLSPQSPGPRRTLDHHSSFAFRTTPETSNKETDTSGLSQLEEEPTPPEPFTFQAPGQPQTTSSSSGQQNVQDKDKTTSNEAEISRDPVWLANLTKKRRSTNVIIAEQPQTTSKDKEILETANKTIQGINSELADKTLEEILREGNEQNNDKENEQNEPQIEVKQEMIIRKKKRKGR